MSKTKIEWAQKVWNPIVGCSKVSEACLNCYAETMTRRLAAMPCAKEKYKNGFEVTLHPECLDEPLKWTKTWRVFVCSMSDLFHEKVPFEYIDKVMDIIERTPHTYQILTKRAKRMAEYFSTRRVPKNVWIGVTCENSKHYDRVDYLRHIPQNCIKFLSCEPLLGDMGDIDLTGIDWVICGGESGVSARKVPVEWFGKMRDVCIKNDVPFFFKQWGAWGQDGIKRNKHENGSLLDGKEWKEYPRKV